MSDCCSKNSQLMHSPLKTMLGKIHLHVEDPETTGLENDNESISGMDTTNALGGPEAEGHPDEVIPSNQAKLTALTREINDLCQ